MKRPICLAQIICLMVLTAMGGLAQSQLTRSNVSPGGLTPPPSQNEGLNQPAPLQQLSLEVKTLRLELHKLQVELQQVKVAQLERELQQAQADARRLATQGNALNQEVAAFDHHLSQLELTADERKEVEANKAELLGGSLETLRAEQRAAAQREAEVSKQLEREQQRLEELLGILKKLRGEASSSSF